MIRESSHGRLILGNCLDVLPTLRDTSAGMVLCDMPYGTTACKWDVVIPLAPMWREVMRVVKPGGAIVLTATQPFSSVLVMSQPDLFKYAWYWCKNFKTGHLNAKKQPMRSVEDILVFCDGQTVYNPQGVVPHGKVKDRGVGATTNRPCGSVSLQTHTGYPHQQLFFDRDLPSVHPTQKPVALFEYLVRTYTNPGDTVVDFCSGSGTTALACIASGRNYVCVEKDPGFYEVGVTRVGEAEAMQALCQPSESHAP